MTKAVTKEKAGDCLALPLLVTGHTLAPEEFNFTFGHYSHEVKQIIAIQEKIWSQTKFTFQLRDRPHLHNS